MKPVKKRVVQPDNIFILSQQVAELKGLTIEGFKGVNEHLRILNGQVVDHSKIITKILAKDERDEGIKDGVKLSWSFIVTVITILIGCAGVIVYALH